MKVVLFLLGMVCCLVSCSPSVATYDLKPARSGEYVILLHGLARSPRSMDKMSTELHRSGFGVCNVGYPSTKKSVEDLSHDVMPEAVEKCRAAGAKKIHFIGHSMGAMLARYYLANTPPREAGRLVQLAPPNQGSEIVDHLGDWPLFFRINGPAGMTLGTGENSLAAGLPAASHPTMVIAGDRSINPINSLIIPGRDDGKVSVKRTKIKGAAAHRVMHVSHPMIMRNRTAIRWSIEFLEAQKLPIDSP